MTRTSGYFRARTVWTVFIHIYFHISPSIVQLSEQFIAGPLQEDKGASLSIAPGCSQAAAGQAKQGYMCFAKLTGEVYQ